MVIASNMKDSTSRAGAHSPYVTSLVAVAIALFGTVALGAFAYIAGSVASPPDIRGALFMRSGYEDAGSEVVRQYRVALRRRNNAELCVIAGMIASVYAQALDEPAALAWKSQERRDCSAAGMASVWGDVRAAR
jgi:hypothetical protein